MGDLQGAGAGAVLGAAQGDAAGLSGDGVAGGAPAAQAVSRRTAKVGAAAGRKARKAGVVKAAASRPNKRQMRLFLDELAETSNITASARAAGMAANSFYRERRRSGEFADAWHEALCEGFVRLETELLSEALVQPSARVNDATLKARAQKYRLGLALLAAHRAAVRGAGRRDAGAAGKDAATGQARQKLGDRLRNVQARARAGAADGTDAADAGLDAAGGDVGGAFDL